MWIVRDDNCTRLSDVNVSYGVVGIPREILSKMGIAGLFKRGRKFAEFYVIRRDISFYEVRGDNSPSDIRFAYVLSRPRRTLFPIDFRYNSRRVAGFGQ